MSNFKCPHCSRAITLSLASPGEQVSCPECNFIFPSPPPIGTIRNATTDATTGNSTTPPIATMPPDFFPDLNTPPPLPSPEIPAFDFARKESQPTSSEWMGNAAISAAKIGAFTLLLIIALGLVSVGVWKAVNVIANLQNQVSSPSGQKYHCPRCGRTAPANVDVCANCGFEFEPVDNQDDSYQAPKQSHIENDSYQTPNKTYSTARKTTRVTITAGDVIIVDDKNGISSVEIQCNDGTIIEADWERNSTNEFGYNIYEPTVNKTTNRLAVMILARKVIANYLNGEYR